ncbi:hypothetical protein Ahia01_001007100, partial [Argonauta hians]
MRKRKDFIQKQLILVAERSSIYGVQLASKIVMRVNVSEIKISAGYDPTQKSLILLNGQVLEKVEHIKYLVAIITATAQGEADINLLLTQFLSLVK